MLPTTLSEGKIHRREVSGLSPEFRMHAEVWFELTLMGWAAYEVMAAF